MSIVDRAVAWFTNPQQWHGPDGIPTRLVEHLDYSVRALVIAAVVGVVLGLLVAHYGRGAFLVVNLANAMRALPSLGLLVLAAVALGFSTLPLIVTLAVLAVPPILVNTFEGVRTVDADVVDAARGMGLSELGVLGRVEVPNALPLILLGLRTAAVQVVATATIAAWVGLGGLGRFINDGESRHDYDTMVGGAVLVVVLALLTEGFFALLERALVSPGVRNVSDAS